MNIADLDFKEHPAGVGGTRAVVEFANGYGASVITGSMFYTTTSAPYELAVLKGGNITYDTSLTDDVLGYLDSEQVESYLADIEALPKLK